MSPVLVDREARIQQDSTRIFFVPSPFTFPHLGQLGWAVAAGRGKETPQLFVRQRQRQVVDRQPCLACYIDESCNKPEYLGYKIVWISHFFAGFVSKSTSQRRQSLTLTHTHTHTHSHSPTHTLSFSLSSVSTSLRLCLLSITAQAITHLCRFVRSEGARPAAAGVLGSIVPG